MPLNKGQRYGRQPTHSIADPHEGKVITGTITAPNDNFQTNLNGIGASPQRDPEPPIEGVLVHARYGNQGVVAVMEEGGAVADSYPLVANGIGVWIHTDRLSKVHVFIGTTNERVHYLAIAQPGE